MIAVVSQAWTLDADRHAAEYVRLNGEFFGFMKQQKGFFSRRLLRGVEDPTHFTNIRLFDSIASYEELTKRPGYAERIQKMGAHLKPYTTYPREYMEVVLDQEQATAR
jgi:heme-degrading monooxygenase HmoA